MTLTIELPPEVEQQVREEAERAGLDLGEYVARTLAQQFTPARPAPASLSAAETELLREINQGFPAEFWQRYRLLIAKRRAEQLSSVEQGELIRMSDQVEEANVRRH